MSAKRKTPLKITFELDAAGLIYDPYCPLMLDGLIDWCLRPMVTNRSQTAPLRTESPQEIALPFEKWHIGGQWGWKASALLIDDAEAQETQRYIRKKFRVDRLHLINGKPNLQAGAQREYNMPYNVMLVNKLIAYCVADRHDIDSLLRRNVKYLGKKRNIGMGRVESITVERIEQDYSISKDGLATRWLPDPNGLRQVRLRPPYFNAVDRVACCEIGLPLKS